MKRLIYISKIRPSVKDDALYELLANARESNREAGISSLLIHSDPLSLQVLEGEKNSLADCYARIRRDWRHENCQILFHDTVAHRAFAGWPLAYRAGRDLERGQVRQMTDIIECAGRLAVEQREPDLWAMEVYLLALLDSFSALSVQ
jgi:hypothetical protein